MHAIVLVGGFGTRLRPLTLTRPKQMLPVGNRPMIERVLEHLAGHGITSAVLSLGYQPEAFTDAYPSGSCAGVSLHYAVEPEPLDTAGAIRFAADDAGVDERCLVLNGDVLTDLDITELIAFHNRCGAEGTVALHRVEDPSAFGVVTTDPTGRVTAFVEKPPRGEAPSDLINAGTYVLEPTALRRIPPGERVNVERVTFPDMVADGALFALDGDTYWIDAGTPASYLDANLDLLSGVRGPGEDGVHPDARVEGHVERSWIGDRAAVAGGATVVGSVILPGARIESGAVVRSSIVGAGARVGSGSVLDAGSVIGDAIEIPAGARLSGARVPEEG